MFVDCCPLLVAFLFTDLSMAVGILGACIGAAIGYHFIALHRHLPAALAVLFFVAFLYLAQMLLAVASLAFLIALIIAAIVYAKYIAGWLDIFSEASGLRLNFRRFRSFNDRIGNITDVYLARRQNLSTLPLDPIDMEDILNNDKTEFITGVKDLTKQFPYAEPDQRSSRRGSGPSPRANDDDALQQWINPNT